MNTLFDQVKDALPVIAIIASVAFSWGSLNAQLSALNTKTDSIVESAKIVSDEVKIVKANQQDMALKLERLETIIEQAQARGLLTKANTQTKTTTPVATVLPSLVASNTAGQSATTTNQSSNQTKTESKETVTNNNTRETIVAPAPAPTPTPQTGVLGTTPIVCLIGALCL